MSPTSYQTAPPRVEIVQYTPAENIVNGYLGVAPIFLVSQENCAIF